MITLLVLSLFLHEPGGELASLRAFHKIDDRLLTSGSVTMEQFTDVKRHGVQHVVTLLPGDQSEEKRRVESLGMTFHQIPVDFRSPAEAQLDTFATLMHSFGSDKALVHCAANMRVSAFVYVYRVTRKNIPKRNALRDLQAIWHPTRQWNGLIRKGLEARGFTPEWRELHPIVSIARSQGMPAAEKVFASSKITDLPETDFIFGAEIALSEDADTLRAVGLYKLALAINPDNNETWYQLGRVQSNQQAMKSHAIKTFEGMLERFPGNQIAMQNLGRLEVGRYEGYWKGVEYKTDASSELTGRWTIPGRFSFTIAAGNSGYTFQPQWMESPIPLLRNPDGKYFVTRWPFVFTYDASKKTMRYTTVDEELEVRKEKTE